MEEIITITSHNEEAFRFLFNEDKDDVVEVNNEEEDEEDDED